MGKHVRRGARLRAVLNPREQPPLKQLAAEVEELRARLNEAEQTLEAIRSGDVDALVVSGPQGEQVYTLKGAEYAYRALVEAMNEGAATVSGDGIVLYCNHRLSEFLQLPQERVIGHPVGPLVAKGQQAELQQLLAQAVAGGSCRAEMQVQLQDGRTAPAYVSLSGVQVGETPAACMVVADLTEHKKRDELIAAGRLARSILDNAAEGIAVCDPDGKIILSNDALRRICGLNPHFQLFDEVLPLDIQGLGLAGEPRSRRFSIAEALAGEELRTEEAIVRRGNGTVLWVLLTCSSMTAASEIIGCVVTLTDITQRKLTERVLRNSEKLAATGQLAATIAHEINNPLTAIFNLLYLIQNESRLGQAQQLANQALTELSRVAHIAKQTLAFYHDGGRPEKVRLPDVLDDIVTMFRKQFVAQKIAVEKHYAVPGEVYCFPGQIRQVFSNIVRNCSDALPEGGRIDLHVRRSRRGNTDGIGVFILDNGPGIAPELRRSIFEPFFTTKGEKGTGLGLWVAHDLVQKHGGVIRVHSRITPKRTGSCFYVFLPCRHAEERYATAS